MSTVLLVEDEDAIREAERLYLEKAGHQVIEATTGSAAVQLWEKHRPQAVVLDLNLPELDGIEVCQVIRKSDPNVPVIMVTARVEEVDELLGLEVGADDYLRKPFSPKVLVARVQALLRRVQPADIPLVFPGLVIDREKQTVNDRPLTTRPFQILELLASNPGRVYSRDDILNRIYGEDADGVYDRVIDAHIKIIRSLLGEAATHLETVVGRGYKFAP